MKTCQRKKYIRSKILNREGLLMNEICLITYDLPTSCNQMPTWIFVWRRKYWHIKNVAVSCSGMRKQFCCNFCLQTRNIYISSLGQSPVTGRQTAEALAMWRISHCITHAWIIDFSFVSISISSVMQTLILAQYANYNWNSLPYFRLISSAQFSACP